MLRATFLTLTRSRAAARLLFGLKLQPLPADAHYFDVTTLALLATARRRIPPGACVVDVGTGSAAVLAAWLWRRGCEVIATEVEPFIAEQAEASLRYLGADVPVRRGSFLAGLEGACDFVLFNPPYVPSAAGVDHGRTERYRSQWDGGPDGTRTIAAFLDAVQEHDGSPAAFLGVNRRHVPRHAVEALFTRHPGLELACVERRALLPVDVYVFSSRKSPIASTSSPDE